MALTYAAFKSAILTSLWQENNSALIANLDFIISMADSELNMTTRDWQRREKTIVINPESQDFNLSTEVPDFQAIQSLTNNAQDTYFATSAKTFIETNLTDIYARRAQNPGGPVLPYYAVGRNDGTRYLRLIGPFSVTDPGDFTMVYRIGMPNYSVSDSSWLEEEYLGLYVYVIAKHAAPWLREDERLQLYMEMARQQYEFAEMDDKHNLQRGGSPQRMKPHRRVP